MVGLFVINDATLQRTNKIPQTTKIPSVTIEKIDKVLSRDKVHLTRFELEKNRRSKHWLTFANTF